MRRNMRRRGGQRVLWPLMAGIWLAAMLPAARAQLDFERPPIDYHRVAVHDPVARLQKKIDSGEIELKFDSSHGYLKSVLENLEIPVSSQSLVFSKTSFQLRKIDPARPRAVYFNDSVYIGWVQQGDVVEVASVDPRQGTIFYTLSQTQSERPEFVRDRGQCLTCHASSRTQGVPGVLVRSVYTAASGQPILGTSTYTTDHRSPLRERWGGWYVSGRHGDDLHMGNQTVSGRRGAESADLSKGANCTDLSKLVSVSPYLSPNSDIVALMVLEHQSQTQNRITRANYECRMATQYDQMMNEMLDRPKDYQSETTKRRLAKVVDELVDFLLFVDEYPLAAPIEGTTDFTREFAARGPRDKKGRSLRDFDLQKRLFRYPCSYLIYSESFDSLPQPVRSLVYRRLWEVLTGKNTGPRFAHLTPETRAAILEILRDTKPSLPDYWR